MWLEFPPWEHVDYKDQTKAYFKTLKRLSNVRLNPKTKVPNCLVTKVDLVEIFGFGCESLKTTNLCFHLDTKKQLVKLYYQVYGTIVVTNNEFCLWFIKGYIAKQKGEVMNQAKKNVFIAREKAR